MPSDQNNSFVLPLLLVCALLAVAVLLRPREQPQGAAGPLPPLMAAGWINSDGPPAVKGKVVVVDAWFTGCGPCLRAIPEMTELYDDWQADDRVQFIGLTWEPEEMLPDIERVIDRYEGFDWPVGYGAQPTLDALGVRGYPTLYVFDESGNHVWTGHNPARLRRELEKLL